MNESDITEHVAAFFLAFLVCGVVLFIAFLPQIDRLVEKWKKRRA